ncbi:DUF1045 domain-containing protein [Ascidiaceihabitans sp.]|uniref:DUF1045 domain-containing protein n=1 Tax=Ascidiaceihabitans sp. TaxID=1872644 RepID=UPI003299F10A
MFERYAVFYTCPTDSDLARFAARWLGWDSASGAKMPRFATDGLDVAEITQNPHKYGFHGTIKAPFRLAEGMGQQDLEAGLDALCSTVQIAPLPQLHLARLGRFLALVPKGDINLLQGLAAQVVQDLDVFRAPLSAAEIERRAPHRLTPQQRGYLDTWGYPHVLDAFRFHMTLTDRLDKPTAAQASAILEKALTGMAMPVQIDALTLMGQATDGRFHQIRRRALN